MKLILSCETSDSFGDRCGCAYALVNLTKERAELLLARMEFVRLESAKGTRFHGCWGENFVTYFSLEGEGLTDEQVTYILAVLPDSDDTYIEISDGFELPEAAIGRSEVDEMDVYEDMAWFTCSPKHTNVHIETAAIERKLLLKVAGKEE